MLSILCEKEMKDQIVELIYRETTTLGIRVRSVEREVLERETVSVKTSFGNIDVKIGRRGKHVLNVMPEFEHVRAAAIASGVAFNTVRDAAIRALNSSASAASK